MTITGDKSIVLSCMQTCRALHASGVSILLRSPINLKRYTQLAPFCTFMLAKHSPRMQWLRQLQLSVDWRDHPHIEEMDNIFDLLAQVLGQVEDLENLEIFGMEDLLDLAPWLSETLCNLTSLQNLAVSGFNRECSEMLSRMDTPKMRSLRLYLPCPCNLSRPLKPSQDHLEELHVCGPAQMHKFNPTMPRVRKLILQDIDLPEWNVSLLVRSFPNLKFFGLITRRSRDDTWRSRRLLNQSQYHDGDWDQLLHVKGSALDLCVLGLKSYVRHLELVNFDKKGLLYLSTLSHDMRPTLLSLGMKNTTKAYLNALASSNNLHFSKANHPTYININIPIYKELGRQNEIIDALLTIGTALHADYLTAQVEFFGDHDHCVAAVIREESMALDLAVTSKKQFKQCTIDFIEMGERIWGIKY